MRKHGTISLPSCNFTHLWINLGGFKADHHASRNFRCSHWEGLTAGHAELDFGVLSPEAAGGELIAARSALLETQKAVLRALFSLFSFLLRALDYDRPSENELSRFSKIRGQTVAVSYFGGIVKMEPSFMLIMQSNR